MAFMVDLNADMVDSFVSYALGSDEELLNHITSCNIACGFHAGDYMVMKKTVTMAAVKNVAVGAHIGFPDLQGFGRRAMQFSTEEIENLTIFQIGARQAFAQASGINLKHVKPHGALYNMAATDYNIARAIAEAIKKVAPDCILLALANSEMVKAAHDVGIKVAQEVFADRAYNPDGTLVSRSAVGSTIHDPKEAVNRVLKMVLYKKVTAINDEDISINADSICVHGDNPQAVNLTRAIRSALQDNNVKVVQLSQVIQNNSQKPNL
jgi:UPF0271 protein